MKTRRTKIVATLGPATSMPKMVERLVKAGVDVFRLNFSHGTLKEHLRLTRIIRQLSQHLNLPIGILADLPGPKLRTGLLKDGGPVYLTHNKICTLTTRNVSGTDTVIPVKYPQLPHVVHKNDRILLADGLLELRVLKTKGKEVECRVVVGGELREQQGINLPGQHLEIPALTSRDKVTIQSLSRAEVDFVALSFVQRSQDIEMARKRMKHGGKVVPLIAKIEKPQALKHIRSILQAADGIMIARGDLGVEVPTSQIPVVQKQLIRLSSDMAVPVITATQMLESMIYNPRPTRAETTDVANAIWDGTDAVMLSGETATGKYPVQVVKMMSKIIQQAEANSDFRWKPDMTEEVYDDRAILRAATRVCNPKIHKAIVTYTETGATAISLSKLRPQVPIYALTPSKQTCQCLSLIWGVRSFYSIRGRNVDEMIRLGDKILIKNAGIKKGDHVILVAGTQLTSGATNMMKIHQVGTTSSRRAFNK